jgi:hypothetical protein
MQATQVSETSENYTAQHPRRRLTSTKYWYNPLLNLEDTVHIQIEGMGIFFVFFVPSRQISR